MICLGNHRNKAQVDQRNGNETQCSGKSYLLQSNADSTYRERKKLDGYPVSRRELETNPLRGQGFSARLGRD